MSKGRAASMTVIYDICRAEQCCSSGCHYPLQDEDLTLGLYGAHKMPNVFCLFVRLLTVRYPSIPLPRRLHSCLRLRSTHFRIFNAAIGKRHET